MMLHSSFWTAKSARLGARTRTAAGPALLIAATIGLALLVPAAVAAEADGSMESIWMDQPGKAAKTQTAAPSATEAQTTEASSPEAAGTDASSGTNGSAAATGDAATSTTMGSGSGSGTPSASGSRSGSAPSSTGGNSGGSTVSAAGTSLAPPADTAAPMCTLEVFKNSALFSKGGWPGVGPFKASESDPSEFVDSKENRVKLELSGDQITRAELTLAGKQSTGNAHKDLLDMQMNADFLLEAVGIKPKRIQDLNVQLEKGRDQLARDGGSLNVVTGRYAVAIDKHGSGNQADFVISVNSLDANRKIIKQHSLTDDTHQSSGTGSIRMTLEQPSHPTVKTVKPGTEKPATSGELKAQFADLINNWQKIKRGAVKSKQVEELSAVLSGKALRRQSDAIKWLQTNKKYYDMTPKGVVVDQFTELLPAKKYMVAAQVHEAYKFIDETNGKVLKEVDDINKVNYTVEKQNGKWLITDSALLAPATTGKTSSTNKTTH